MKKLKGLISLVIIVVIVIGVVKFIDGNKKPVDIENFTTVMTQAGFKVEDLELNPYVENFKEAKTAVKDKVEIMCFSMYDSQSANQEAKTAAAILDNQYPAKATTTRNFAKGTETILISDSNYCLIENIEDSLLIAIASKDDKQIVSEINKRLTVDKG